MELVQRYDLLLQYNEDRCEELGSNLDIEHLMVLILEKNQLLEEGWSFLVIKCYG